MAAVLSLSAVFLFVLVITVPFLGQALHVDDALFWDFARNNLVHPLQQHLAGYHLMGEDVAAFRDTHPPVDELYMSLLMLVSGTTSSEAVLHLGFIIFPLIAGASMFFLARRFTRNALLATFLLLATPGVMLLSHTLMADLPMTAFWLAATAAYIYGVDRDDTRLLAAASLLITLAVFTGYQALALIVLLPAYAWLSGRLRWKTALPLLLPLLAFAAFTWLNFAYYGAPPRFSHAAGLSMKEGDVITRFQGMLLQMGGISVFPLFLAVGFMLRRRRYLALPLLAGIAAVLGWRQLAPGYPAASAVLFVVFMFAGSCMLTAVVWEGAVQLANRARRLPLDRDFLFLGFWLVSILGAVVILLPHATAKYYLPVFAPLILLLFREAEAALKPGRLLKGLAVAAIGLSFFTGLWLSAADYQLAQAYKDFALSVEARYHPTGTVWFVGEWGFRHYMESEGYKYLTSTSTAPRPGDLIIRPSFMNWPLEGSLLGRIQRIEVPAVTWSVPLRVMSMDADAGFYGTYWGRLPYTITSSPVEQFEVYRVTR